MTTPPAAVRCRVPGCPGFIEDGYCNVCGSPADAPVAPPLASPSATLGVGVPTGSAVPGAPTDPGSAAVRSVGTGRTSSARLASQAIGSARSGTSRSRRLTTTSVRLRGQRLGAGLTTVPPTPVTDPMSVVMTDAVVPEPKRFCPACGSAVGRSRDGVPGRTDGFCPACGTRFDFRPQLGRGDLVGGQYETVGCLAHGGLGWIYLARDRNVSDRWVVLKGLLNSGDADAVAAAIAERQFLAEVEHPLIVEIYNFATFAGAGYIVMEYVGGRSLKQILTERRAKAGRVDPLPVDQALAYVLEILPAFSYLHDRGLLYCDFKPDNLVSQGESVKLIDLGGVRRVDDQVSAIFGTVGYQAPEVPDVGPSVASDIYTIGRTLATLVLDFRGNTTTYVAALPPVADTPVLATYDSFYRLLAKACAPDPNDRFGTVDELRVQLLGVLREVVATDQGLGRAASSSTMSALFAAPAVEVADRPLRWDELPALRRDEQDPCYGWLAGVTVTDPGQRWLALADAPEASPEVLLDRIRAATELGRHADAHAVIDQLLDADPWDWRAAWMSGLVALASGDPVGARASFNAVYGQVPGELAPKLALATTCELSDELDVAESLYLICASADANYTSPAAFGLARIRQHRGDVPGALAALDLVNPTRGSYPRARLARARLLSGSGQGLVDLARSLEGLDTVPVPEPDRAALRLHVLRNALHVATQPGHPAPPAGLTVGGVDVGEPHLRDGVEAAYRSVAQLTDDPAERVRLVDEANAVRRWTFR